MGNKIGFEVDSEQVKLVYIQTDKEKVAFIQNLESKYLEHQFQKHPYTIFIFKCRIQQFLQYHKSQNVKLLRKQYESMLIVSTQNSTEELIINTNHETINRIKENQQIKEALMAIVLNKVKLQHKMKAQMSLDALYFLQNSGEYYKFANTFNLLELHEFNLELIKEHTVMETLPEKFLLVLIRNGISIYKVEKEKKLERVSGSIIGEKTILAILKLKFPNKNLDSMINDAFYKGDNRNLDLLVSDIYGANTKNLGLPAELIASSLGRLGKMKTEEVGELSEVDICRSVLIAFAINVALLTSIYMKNEKLEAGIVLGDKLHNPYFYLAIQSIFSAFSPDNSIYFGKHAPYMSCLGTIFKQN